MEWQDISTAPKDETNILVGHWSENEKIWLWITQGSFDADGDFYDSFNDDVTNASNMIYWNTPTHWRLTFTEPPPPKE